MATIFNEKCMVKKQRTKQKKSELARGEMEGRREQMPRKMSLVIWCLEVYEDDRGRFWWMRKLRELGVGITTTVLECPYSISIRFFILLH